MGVIGRSEQQNIHISEALRVVPGTEEVGKERRLTL